MVFYVQSQPPQFEQKENFMVFFFKATDISTVATWQKSPSVQIQRYLPPMKYVNKLKFCFVLTIGEISTCLAADRVCSQNSANFLKTCFFHLALLLLKYGWMGIYILKTVFIYFWQRGREAPMCKRNINRLPLARPQQGTWPATEEACILNNFIYM